MQSFDFQGESIRIWENANNTFDFSAGDIFRVLGHESSAYQDVYGKLKVTHIAPEQLFRHQNGDLISIKMLKAKKVIH